MSSRFMSERYPLNPRAELSSTSFHGERNFPRSRRPSPYFRDEANWNPDESYSLSKYSREERYISDHRIRERSLSPRDRSHIPLRRSQEPDLRNYLDASHQYDRKLSDFDREGRDYNRPSKDFEMINQTSDWKYDRSIDVKTRLNQDSIDLRNRELLSRRDYRDEKYLFDSERDRQFTDLRDELHNSRRGRYSPDHKDQAYFSSEPRREDPFDYRDKIYLANSSREKHPSDFREEAHLSDFRRSWPSPDGRRNEPSDSDRWYRDQRPTYKEFLTESDRNLQTSDKMPTTEFERDWRHPDQSRQNYSFSSLRGSDPRFERSYNDTQGMIPMSVDRSLSHVNREGPRMDYQIEDSWNNGHPSHWNDKGNLPNINISGPDRRMASFPVVNNEIPYSGNLKSPFIPDAPFPKLEYEVGTPFPKFTVLIQYLYNFNQPFTVGHIEYVKDYILRYWTEEEMNSPKGSWLPSFLDCIPVSNGLAVVCADRRSFRWLLNKKIKGLKGFFFANTDARAPIKRVKLAFQIPSFDITPNEALRKIHQENRGNQVNFDRFKVLSCKRNKGCLNVIVLTDSWSANKLKTRLNWRPKYGNRRIRMFLMGRKKKKPTSAQPGEVKPTKDKEPAYDLAEFDDIEDDSLSESYDEL
ncbi:uncharacterized protein [Halyomorpha halys]|uniref:uncharacterized protein isoform X2 n=1 Tax=Halyomorpha halys TaxID=286706 RepID=UPI0006D4DB58|nr:uncharacterized protein LOC106692697 [Halyomorpha halys]XP_014294402.1 uncharacterized protein LOC106692697 [Halyomorpha halys]XP_014294491.1 uncharacterized protein LOC106692697 [Halyomorpha halys]XP_014294567.1 uncharacterized protein LOC106692697 [Halyomorpha halys]XP_014294635.1 uncharacterized protein LOC106692697 [Halyomorpha halys]XP_014294713.1 uncharacterized protein LOC106692697 [Halyomorpha halys]